MDIMTFMEENYIVLILVGVIILMTIIGYIADKTDFGKKDKKKDKKENKKQNEVVEDVNEEQEDNSFVEEADCIEFFGEAGIEFVEHKGRTIVLYMHSDNAKNPIELPKKK